MKLQTFVQAYLGHCFYGCFTKQQKKVFFLKRKKKTVTLTAPLLDMTRADSDL